MVLKANGWKSALSASSSNKNGGKKRKRKDKGKRKQAAKDQSKRHKSSESADSAGSNYDTPDSDEKPNVTSCSSPEEIGFKGISSQFKSSQLNFDQKVTKIPELWHQKEDRLMAESTTKFHEDSKDIMVSWFAIFVSPFLCLTIKPVIKY